jgi:hypothetical protein
MLRWMEIDSTVLVSACAGVCYVRVHACVCERERETEDGSIKASGIKVG